MMQFDFAAVEGVASQNGGQATLFFYLFIHLFIHFIFFFLFLQISFGKTTANRHCTETTRVEFSSSGSLNGLALWMDYDLSDSVGVLEKMASSDNY